MYMLSHNIDTYCHNCYTSPLFDIPYHQVENVLISDVDININNKQRIKILHDFFNNVRIKELRTTLHTWHAV